MLDSRVNTTGMKVFMALALHADKETGLVGQFKNSRYYTPGYNRIGIFAGIKRRSVINGVKNLVFAGWIGIKIRRFDNTSILYLAMPNDLDLADSDNKFKVINSLLTDQDIKANEEVLRIKNTGGTLIDFGNENEQEAGDDDDDDDDDDESENGLDEELQFKFNKNIAFIALHKNTISQRAARSIISYQDAVFDIFSFAFSQERQYDDDKIENLGLSYDMDLTELRKEFPQIAAKFY